LHSCDRSRNRGAYSGVERSKEAIKRIRDKREIQNPALRLRCGCREKELLLEVEKMKSINLNATNLFVLRKQHLAEGSTNDDIAQIVGDVGALSPLKGC
jgi:hypothetical protein